MTLIVDPCPICGTDDFAALYPGNIPASDDPCLYFSSSRKKAGHLPIARCRHCGLVMTNPRDHPDTLNEVYARLQDPLYDEEEHNRLKTARGYLRIVRKFAPAPRQLLDVGCSTGIFLKLAQDGLGPATGIEPSKWAAEAARRRSPDSSVICEMLEQVSFPANRFDAITLWDVLEHVSNPVDTLNRLHAWLAPGGMLFLNVPNVESWIARVMRENWVLYLREHLWYFSPRTIQRLLTNCQFDLVLTRPNYVWFSVSTILARIGQYGHPFARLANGLSSQKALQQVAVRFPIGEMNVVARKRSQVVRRK